MMIFVYYYQGVTISYSLGFIWVRPLKKTHRSYLLDAETLILHDNA